MIVSLDRRIKKLEGVLPNREFMSLVLGALREIGYEELAARMTVGMPRILLRSVDDTDILDLEEFRGLVPDEDIRAAYSLCRNYAYLPDKARLIRERAGVIDGQGNVMPGYVLMDNGCIVGDLATAETGATAARAKGSIEAHSGRAMKTTQR